MAKSFYFQHTDNNGDPTDYTIICEAREIVDEALRYWSAEDAGCEAFIREAIDGHRWVIHSYAALQIVANCFTMTAESRLEEMGYEPPTHIGVHASAIVYEMLLDACLNELHAKTIEGGD